MAGGIAEYLGVDSALVRLAFVLLTVLAAVGPPIYLVAWLVLPEGRADGPYRGQVMPSRPWQEWDRSARSWAIVLGCVAVAAIWSFGIWPAWRWGAVPFWAIALALVFFWALRHPHRWGGPLVDNGPVPGTTSEAATGQTGDIGAVPPTTVSPTASWDYDLTTPLVGAVLGAPLGGAGTTPQSSFAGTPRNMLRGLRSLAATLAALVTALLLAAVITVIAVTLSSGSSFRGGVGQHNAVPLTVSDIRPQYHLAAGDLDVDLSHVKFPLTGQTTLVITVGLGQLMVSVPRGTRVSVRANVGIGNVQVFSLSGSSVNTPSGTGPGGRSNQPQLSIIAHVGLGDIEVSRG